MKKIDIARHKHQIKTDFNQRKNYDDREFYHYYGKKLVELAPLKQSDRVLDIATGTGVVAIAAAKIVSQEGHVIGVDMSPGMLEKAQAKIEFEGLKNIEFKEADVEELELPEKSFDGILSSLAVIYFTNIPAALAKFYNWLKPGGFVAFNAWSENAFYPSGLFRRVVRKYGVEVPEPNKPLGTPERCYQMAASAGFSDIKIHQDVSGWYYSPDAKTALSTWRGNSQNAFGFQVFDLPPEQLELCKAEFMAEFKQIESSDRGSWLDATAYFVIAHKNEVTS